MKTVPLFYRLLIVLTVSACFPGACKRPPASQRTEQTPVAQESDSPPSLLEAESPQPLAPEETPPPVTAEAPSDAYFALCNGQRIELAAPVREIAAHISADSVMYDRDNPKNFADCSGIFHRLLDSMRVRCADVDLPGKSARSSRDLARWFHRKGRLQLIRDPLAATAHLQPGAVLFYGGRGADATATPDVQTVTRGINHVGIVVDVEKNEAGEIINYGLFHGQWLGKTASVTRWHKRDPSRVDYPPYGNGSEPWVAVATLLPEEEGR